jgi:hypothetical protein
VTLPSKYIFAFLTIVTCENSNMSYFLPSVMIIIFPVWPPASFMP